MVSCFYALAFQVSTHSRPKAAGQCSGLDTTTTGGFNTQPPEGGWANKYGKLGEDWKFQHTAARRRLAGDLGIDGNDAVCFNTQPPEGGW